MSVDFPCDILVVGAGPAGSCAAAAAAGAGVGTVLIDAKVRIGEQPHCGEFVPERLFVEFELNRSSIVYRVDSMETRIIEISREETISSGFEAATGKETNANVSLNMECAGGSFLCEKVYPAAPSGKFISCPQATLTESPGFMIDRVRFDRDLARDAAAGGATVLCSTRLLRKENHAWIAGSGKEEISFSPRFVIAADGALSTVARALSLRQADVLRGLQIEAPFCGAPDRTYIFLDRCFVGGYGWVFPKGKTANVGIGVVPSRGLDAGGILAKFVDHLCRVGLIRPGQLARSGGVIPASGLRDSLVVGNAVFCGDAAGLTHPITGAGIPQAILSGQEAGRAVAATIKTGRRQHLAEYEAEIRGRYRGVIDHALKKRRVMMDNWRESDFSRVCERTWIAFKGYRIRERSK